MADGASMGRVRGGVLPARAVVDAPGRIRPRRLLLALALASLVGPTVAWASDGTGSDGAIGGPIDAAVESDGAAAADDTADPTLTPDGDGAAVPDEGADAPGTDAPEADGTVVLDAVPVLIHPGLPHGEPAEVTVVVRRAQADARIERLELCLRAPGGEADCARADEAPDEEVLLVWAPDTGVEVSGDGRHRELDSTVTATEDGLEARFRVAVGPTTRAGSRWRATVTAFDLDGVAGSAESGAIEVAWFRARLEDREELAHGELAAGQMTGGSAGSGGRFVVNGPALVVLRSTPFAHDGDVLALAAGAPGRPAPWRTVALDCSLGTSVSETTAVRATTTWQVLGVAPPAMPSSGIVSISTACSISYGGGARHLGVRYSNDVDVDLVAAVP